MPTGFLTIEQVCAQLGVTIDDVKSMVAEGRLAEVRDSGKVFYRAADVESLAAKEGSSVVDLAMPDESAPADLGEAAETESFASALSSLADSSSGLSLLDDSAAGVSPIDEISPVPGAEPSPAPGRSRVRPRPRSSCPAFRSSSRRPRTGARRPSCHRRSACFHPTRTRRR